MIYRKRDIVFVPVPFTDNKNTKVRPALVISDDQVHATGDAMIVQITSKVKNDNLSITIEKDDVSLPLPVKSFIRCHKIFVLEKNIILEKISELNTKKYKAVIKRINQIIR